MLHYNIWYSWISREDRQRPRLRPGRPLTLRTPQPLQWSSTIGRSNSFLGACVDGRVYTLPNLFDAGVTIGVI